MKLKTCMTETIMSYGHKSLSFIILIYPIRTLHKGFEYEFHAHRPE